jgi:hypothetical protein
MPVIGELLGEHCAIEGFVVQLRTASSARSRRSPAGCGRAILVGRRMNSSIRSSARCRGKGWILPAAKSIHPPPGLWRFGPPKLLAGRASFGKAPLARKRSAVSFGPKGQRRQADLPFLVQANFSERRFGPMTTRIPKRCATTRYLTQMRHSFATPTRPPYGPETEVA